VRAPEGEDHGHDHGGNASDHIPSLG